MNSTPVAFQSTRNLSSGVSPLCDRLFDSGIFHIGDPTPKIINCVVNTATSITAILGNLLVILSVWKTPSLHSPSYVLLCGLALADFAIGLAVQPLFVVFLIARINGQTDVICTSGIVLSVCGYFLCGVSLVTLTTISLDRFLALYLHLRYKSFVTIQRMFFVLFLVWFTIGCAATTPLFAAYETLLLLSLPVSCLCICLIVFCYLYIARVVRRHQVQIRGSLPHGPNSLNMGQFKNSCFTMFLVSSIFLVYYLPYVVVTVWITQGGYTAAMQTIFDFSSTILFVGSSINPLVYCLRLREMRVAFRRTLNAVIPHFIRRDR